jgi:plastocyanin
VETATSSGTPDTGTSSRHSRFRSALCLAAAGIALAAAGAVLASVHAASAHAVAVQQVTVKMSEYRFRLSTNTVHTGTVVFTIVNRGQIQHDFAIQKLQKVSPLVQPGHKTTMRVTFKRVGTYYYLCTVGAHVQYGMFGNLHVKR